VVEVIRDAGGEAIVKGNDVSDWVGAKALVDEAVGAFGRLDVLINNAGILRDRMMVNMTEQEWDSVIKVHLKGTFAPSHHAAQYWRQEAKRHRSPVSARLINMSSASGLFGNVGQTNYGAAKVGIAAFTIISATELRQYGITVNAIAPRADPDDGRIEGAHRGRDQAAQSALGRADHGLAGQRGIPRRHGPACSKPATAFSKLPKAGTRGQG
jgi:NAD(P)-dependent dehydrogenase (short-subunit alcohol dehydrogenase family)